MPPCVTPKCAIASHTRWMRVQSSYAAVCHAEVRDCLAHVLDACALVVCRHMSHPSARMTRTRAGFVFTRRMPPPVTPKCAIASHSCWLRGHSSYAASCHAEVRDCLAHALDACALVVCRRLSRRSARLPRTRAGCVCTRRMPPYVTPKCAHDSHPRWLRVHSSYAAACHAEVRDCLALVLAAWPFVVCRLLSRRSARLPRTRAGCVCTRRLPPSVTPKCAIASHTRWMRVHSSYAAVCHTQVRA